MTNARRRAYVDDRPHNIDHELWSWFCGRTEKMPAEGYFVWDLGGLFRRHERAIVEEWLRDHPDSRPPPWWQYCAPEPRRQISGKGKRRSEGSACVPQYRNGVPSDFIEIDEADPPVFESEADYLKRLGL